ncbi:MAG: nitrous oxide reductase accessory protein NosL [Gemmatimonadales bacterium]|nr:nitrous oxide reductase accessory protein NosL [Gemmatimonadales bacterium]
MRAALAALALLHAACSVPGPRPVALGSELCGHCHMTVSDDRFIAQVVTTTGKVLIYDDPGCLANALRDGEVARDRIRSIWVTDYLDTGSLIAAEGAWFVRSDAVHTPMGSGLAAVRSSEQARSLAEELGGTVVRWEAVQDDTGHRH